MVADMGIGEDELVIEYKVRGGGVRGGGWRGKGHERGGWIAPTKSNALLCIVV